MCESYRMKMQSTAQGVINPWAKNNSDVLPCANWPEFAKSHEVDVDRYRTPFHVMIELLESWPMILSQKTTAECDDEERFRRLMQVVGGYPLIGGGYRPLDFPSHPQSKLGLVFSLYLDTIHVKGLANWHSLRSFLMMLDVQQHNGEQTVIEPLLINVTKFILLSLREHEQPAGHEAQEFNQHFNHEIRHVLSVIHSTASGREKFWLKHEDSMDSLMVKLRRQTGWDTFDHLDMNVYEIKFRKIQSWIRFWGNNTENLGNTAQNLITGPSVFLEGIFARLRAFIIKEYGVGSISVDGGGRITFLSKKNKEDVEGDVKTMMLEALYESADNRDYRHPYQSTIEERLRTYIVESAKKESEWWNAYLEDAQNDKDRKKREEKPTQQAAFDWLIGEKAAYQFLPSVSINDFPITHSNSVEYDGDEEHERQQNCDHGALKNDQREDSNKVDVGERWRSYWDHGCVFCDETKYQFKTLTTKSCTLVCPIHWLMYSLSRTHKLRLSSLSTELGPDFELEENTYGQIKDIVWIDGNSLGNLFTATYNEKLDLPTMDELNHQSEGFKKGYQEKEYFKKVFDTFFDKRRKEFEKIWEKYYKINTRLNKQLTDEEEKTLGKNWGDVIKNQKHKWENLTTCPKEEIAELPKKRRDFPSFLNWMLPRIPQRLRERSFVFQLRRSFDFNARWSVCFHNTVLKNEKSLFPWVFAGDDLVLVNRSGLEEAEVSEILASFHENLQQSFPTVPLSFAGGWARREETTTIFETLRVAGECERIAKHTWKHQIQMDESGLSERLLKNQHGNMKSGCETCANAATKWLEGQERESLYVYRSSTATDSSSPHSLLLKLGDETLEELKQQDPTTFQK